MKKFIEKNKKILIMLLCSLILILSGTLSWNLYFSKYKIFYENEDKFTETVKRYYEMNSNYLPKKNETREVTLQDLYDKELMDDIYIPKTNKLCDSNSWVRVYQDNDGNYTYTTYLKCGKYESKVDHTGPVITLNGDSEIVLSYGSTYNEEGVSKVVDDTDGEMNISDVVIDSSKIDTNTVGTYEVTYTIRDKAYNKTVVTRKVTVAKNLTNIVRDFTDDTGYYKGNDVNNNYILFSGMLFRIINVNSDGSIKIISDESVTNLRMNSTTYQGSNAETWLNNIYLKALNNTDTYLVDSTYCVGNITSINDYSNECSSTVTAKVGLLSTGEYMKTVVNSDTFLDNSNYYALASMIGTNYAASPIAEDTINGLRSTVLAGIRPVLTLKNDLYIINGDGTSSNPYKLPDYKYASINDTINTRLIGEYVEYSGLNFRIIGIDSNSNVRLIMDEPWSVMPNNENLTLSVADIDNLEFNLEDKNNPGYILNNEYTDYINMKYIVETEYEIPTNNEEQLYSEYTTKKIKAKILLPKTYELFASIGNNDLNRGTSFLYIDESTSGNSIFMANGGNGLVFQYSKDAFYAYNIKIIITIKGNLKISTGNGTVNKPYVIKE